MSLGSKGATRDAEIEGPGPLARRLEGEIEVTRERGPSERPSERPSESTAAPDIAVRVTALGHGWSRGGREQLILDTLDLEVAVGETVALIGRSGSGKSTLLNLIGGLEPVRTGSIEVFGESLGPLDDRSRTLLRRRSIGFVHQAFNLIPTLTVGDNVTLPLALGGVPARERRERLDAQLEAVGLEGRADDHPDTLSGGEQQRRARPSRNARPATEGSKRGVRSHAGARVIGGLPRRLPVPFGFWQRAPWSACRRPPW